MHTTTSLLISFLMYSDELVLTGSHAFCLQCLTYFHLLLTGCNYWQVAGQREVLEYDVKYDMTCQEVIILLLLWMWQAITVTKWFLHFWGKLYQGNCVTCSKKS